VKRQIARLKEPCLKCVDLVVNELTSVVHRITEKGVRLTPGARTGQEHGQEHGQEQAGARSTGRSRFSPANKVLFSRRSSPSQLTGAETEDHLQRVERRSRRQELSVSDTKD
jgi:hypothetical protein